MRKVGYTITLVAIFLLALVSYIWRYDIHDWMVLRSYEPAPDVALLAEKSLMSNDGRDIFYVHDPQVLDAEQFNEVCLEREASIVLGCFNGVQIYIYDVDNEKLAGVKEITAVHEMLHAVYMRLGDKERQTINEWLSVAEESITNQRIKNVISNYKDLPEEDMFNELHSIIGTEVRDIPDYLENHYAKYIQDRQGLVDISERYETVFTDIQSQIDNYDQQLAALSLQIRTKEISLENKYQYIQTLENELNRLYEMQDAREYNALLDDYRRYVTTYNAEVDDLQNNIDTYNSIVIVRNELGIERNDLVQSIDSRFDEVNE